MKGHTWITSVIYPLCALYTTVTVLLFHTFNLACAFTIDIYWQIIHHKTNWKVLALNCNMLGWGFIYPYRHDLTEILLKVALNTINLNPNLFTHKQNQQNCQHSNTLFMLIQRFNITLSNSVMLLLESIVINHKLFFWKDDIFFSLFTAMIS